MTDAQFDRLVGLLTDMRAALAYLCQPVEAPAAEADQACAHEETRRTDFSTPHEVHWICGDCGHEERRFTSTRAPASTPSASAEE